MEDQKQSFWKPSQAGIFFPLLLIGVGVVLLLKTLGLIDGDLWAMFLKVWPVLFIVSGLDNIYRRDGIVGGVAWAGLGVIILLANLGYLPALSWGIIFRIWPFALVVWGLDILFHQRSWLTAVTAFLAGLVVVGLIYWVIMTAPGTRTLQSEAFQTQAGDAQQANIVIEATTGSLSLQDGAASDNLAEGEIERFASEDYQYSYIVTNGTGDLTIKSGTEGNFQFWFPGSSDARRWTINLTGTTPLDITSKLVIGEQTADFSALMLEDAQVETVMGRSTIFLPERAAGVIELSVVMGEMVVYIPQGIPISIELDTAITALDYPNDFIRVENGIRSPGGDAAGALQVKINLPIGSLRVQYAE